MVESGERSEGGINKGEEREGERSVALTPYPTPSLFFFTAHIS